jgi:tetratricopeptide (TPR) repeat protein
MRGLSTRSVLSFVLLWGAAAYADDAEAKAKDRFKAAQAAYDLGQFDKALAGYSDAYALKPMPAFLFNIAQCHKQLGQWERAAFFYRRFEAMAPEGTDRAKLTALIAQMDQRLAEQQQKQEKEKDAATMHAHSLELEKARAVTAQAEADAAAQRANEAAAAAKLVAATPPPVPLYQRWWLWAGAGAVVAVGASITAVAIATRPHAESPSFGTVNAR